MFTHVCRVEKAFESSQPFFSIQIDLCLCRDENLYSVVFKYLLPNRSCHEVKLMGFLHSHPPQLIPKIFVASNKSLEKYISKRKIPSTNIFLKTCPDQITKIFLQKRCFSITKNRRQKTSTKIMEGSS